jgi:hypothetical protein
MNPITQRAFDATARYQRFLDQLRAQYEIALRNDPTHGSTRLEAGDAATEFAKDWLASEADVIRIDTYGMGDHSYQEGLQSAKVPLGEAPTELQDHFGNTGDYLVEILAAQASRDISAMKRAIAAIGIRADMAQRSGARQVDAIANLMLDAPTLDFRFVDRAGRSYSSSKHVRDQYRLHLLMTINDGFLFAMSEAGIDRVEISNPNPQNKWDGTIVSTEAGQGKLPSYYDIRDEVFHPSSDSRLVMVEE